MQSIANMSGVGLREIMKNTNCPRPMSNHKHNSGQALLPLDIFVMRHFFNNVMICLGHHEWLITFGQGSDSYCNIRDKIINIGIDYGGDLKQIILHEIAHIGTAKYCNQKHNPQFWKRLEYLVWRFLRTELDKHQKNHKQWMGKGIYALYYHNGV